MFVVIVAIVYLFNLRQKHLVNLKQQKCIQKLNLLFGLRLYH